ncbi:hypothetical protein FJD32_000805 [Shewanella sp. LC6]|jgi:hypothetical protein|uniref:hypothetical protein n=1 Tax=Shewanella TaxID=22 RepID=UPI0006E196B8|nr:MULTISPECIES: hypothetical protein [Shewanella]ASF16515.1 hypothetical protein CEQ32_16915 [Shewanella sp. FDAARGOS_354]MDH1468509.1 hypothetical protein [Shewanella sp. GD03713]QQK58162.1 hypothetical protein FJD32_000805 [Shewanella sp. LC6]TPE65491.1 hypothetical protein FJD33_00520 [Shewanella sp. LC2]
MNLVQEIHQAHFFTDNQDVTASPPIVTALMNSIGKFNLIPNMGQEINAITGERKLIPMMVSPDQSLHVEFPRNEIVIIGTVGSQHEFMGKSLGIFEALASVFPEKKGNRLSILNSRIFKAEEDTYSCLYRQLFTHHKAQPFEWDNRIVERRTLPKCGETINSISSIRRCEIMGQAPSLAEPMDCVIFDLDSNTVQHNTKLRFSLEQAHVVFKELHENNLALSKQLKRYTE